MKRPPDPVQAGLLRLMQAAAALRERIHRGQGSLLVDIAAAAATGMNDEHAYAYASALMVAAVEIVERRVFRK